MKRLDWVGLAALPAAVGLLYGVDWWLDSIRAAAAADFTFRNLNWIIPLFDLAYAVVVLGLFWLVNRTNNRGVQIAYLVVGVVLAGYPLLRFEVLAYLPPSIRDIFPFGGVILNPDRGLYLSGAFIAAMGAWALLGKRPEVVPEA